MVIILDLEVIKAADQVAGKIGDPTPYVEGESVLHYTEETRNVVWLLGLCCWRIRNITLVHLVVDVINSIASILAKGNVKCSTQFNVIKCLPGSQLAWFNCRS